MFTGQIASERAVGNPEVVTKILVNGAGSGGRTQQDAPRLRSLEQQTLRRSNCAVNPWQRNAREGTKPRAELQRRGYFRGSLNSTSTMPRVSCGAGSAFH